MSKLGGFLVCLRNSREIGILWPEWNEWEKHWLRLESKQWGPSAQAGHWAFVRTLALTPRHGRSGHSIGTICLTFWLSLFGYCSKNDLKCNDKSRELVRKLNTIIQMPKVTYILVAESAVKPEVSDGPLCDATSWGRWSDPKIAITGCCWFPSHMWPSQEVTLRPVLFWTYGLYYKK